VWIFGGSGNDSLNAGNAGSVLSGGSGNDELLGGSGRDLQIGGLGADHLVGNAGDDILIAARSDYDRDLTALCKIMDEWQRTDASFDTRVQHLEGALAGGLNGAIFLNTTTLHDDGAVDQVDILTGSAGDDWYLYKSGTDKATGVSTTEAADALTNV
jgi:Ca2+-binding RTX toxin-like protein